MLGSRTSRRYTGPARKGVTALAALTLTLGAAACSSSDPAPEETPVQIATVDDLTAYAADRYNGTAELLDGDLTLAVDSQGSELRDQDMTVKLLQTIAEADLDYGTVTITTGGGEGPTWGYRYDADTVQEIGEASIGDGSLVVTDIWDRADA